MAICKTLHYITHWESWHWFAKYILLGPVWLWYCLKARSLWFFSSCNPTITFGGYVGETKEEVYKLLPPEKVPSSIFINPALSLTEVVRMMDAKGLVFPLAAKAASGIMGFMFRKIESMDQLRKYHAYMPVNYILQEYIDYPLEVSVFYYRIPGEQIGNITGFVRKDLPQITGDGDKTIWQLICQHPQLRYKLDEMRKKHASHLDRVLDKGEHYVLSQALNLSRGGKLVSLEQLKDEKLLAVFDELSHYSGQLYFGRYDIRCNSIDELKAGKNFMILEFNGCGGEPHHVYGNGNSLFRACRILVQHWQILYRISMINHRKGHRLWKYKPGAAMIRKSVAHIVKLKQLDKGFSFDPLPAPHHETAQLETLRSYN